MSEADSSSPQQPRPPYHRPLFGSSGSLLLKAGVLAAVFAGGFVVGADDPDAKNLVKQLEADIEREAKKVPDMAKLEQDLHPTDHRDRAISTNCLNPPSSKPIVGLAGIHVDGAVGFDLTSRLEHLPVRTVRQMGISFTYLRSSRGTSGSSKDFKEAWSRLATCEILRGVIHDYRPDQSPDKQLKNFLAQTGGSFGELPPVIEVERAHGTKKHRCDTELPELEKFVESVAEATRSGVVIRTSADFWNKHYNCSGKSFKSEEKRIVDHSLWVIDPDQKEPRLPIGWTTWAFWEKASKGRLGRDGKVPVQTFNGSIHKLDDWSKDQKNG